MHATLQFFVFWFLAFLSLAGALGLLHLYSAYIGNDLEWRTPRQEATLAGFASLFEGASVWALVLLVPNSVRPLAGRGLIITALLVAFLYKLSHLTEWSRYHILLLLLFQVVIAVSGTLLLRGHFEAALILLTATGLFLGLFAGIVRSLSV